MFIDINTPLTGDLAKASSSTSTLPPDVAKLLSELKLTVGQTLEAPVTKTTPITTEERALLLQLKSSESTNRPRDLKTWSNILSNPNLKHAELKLPNTLLQILTTAPLNKGQLIQVAIKPNGLHLFAAPLAHNISGTTAKNIDTTALKATIQKEIISHSAKTESPLSGELQKSPLNSNFTHKSINSSLKLQYANNVDINGIKKPAPLTKIEAELKAALTAVLPKSQKHSELFTTTEKLISTILSSPQNSRPKELNNIIRTLHTLVAKHGVDLKNLNNGSLSQHIQASKTEITERATNYKSPTKEIQSALQKNGVFYENRIFREAISTSNKNQLTDRLNQIVQNDFKSALIQLSEQIAQTLQTIPTNKILGSGDAISKLWINLLQIANQNSASKSNTNPPKQLLQFIQQVVQQSLSKIQVRQYQTLLSQTQDPNSPLLTHHLDIPIKTPEGYANIYMQIFEPKITEDQKSKKQYKNSKKTQKWKLFMEMELDNEGELAVELNLCNKDLDATFWAEQDNLRQKTEKSLNQLKLDLEKKGLTVTDLRCSKNNPPKQTMKMDFSLIDVRT